MDDEDDIRFLLRSILENNNYTVIEASDGLEALKLALSEKPQIVLLDVEMPAMSGMDVCKKLGSDPSFTGKIIMVSGHKEPWEIVTGLDRGALEYITKPIHEDVLVSQLKAVLREVEKASGFRERDGQYIEKDCFKLCRQTRSLWHSKRKISSFTKKQCEIVDILMENSPNYVTIEAIFNRVWKGQAVEPQTVNVHISFIKQKLGNFKSKIEHSPGQGYRFVTTL